MVVNLPSPQNANERTNYVDQKYQHVCEFTDRYYFANKWGSAASPPHPPPPPPPPIDYATAFSCALLRKLPRLLVLVSHPRWVFKMPHCRWNGPHPLQIRVLVYICFKLLSRVDCFTVKTFFISCMKLFLDSKVFLDNESLVCVIKGRQICLTFLRQ